MPFELPSYESVEDARYSIFVSTTCLAAVRQLYAVEEPPIRRVLPDILPQSLSLAGDEVLAAPVAVFPRLYVVIKPRLFGLLKPK